MEKIDVNRNRHFTTWSYSDDQVHDTKSACIWITEVVKVPNLRVDYITLKDMTNRNDEGNTSAQITQGFSELDIYKNVQEADIDVIHVTGNYKGKLIVVGVDLREKTIWVTLKNSDAKLIEEIEESLGLAE